MANKVTHNKKALLKALEKSKGIVTTACEISGVCRSNYYKYYRDDPKFKESVDELSNVALDFAESKLFQKMEGITMSKGEDQEGEPVIYKVPPSDTALIFYLKTKGKNRGYVEKTEIDVNQNNIQFILPEGYEH